MKKELSHWLKIISKLGIFIGIPWGLYSLTGSIFATVTVLLWILYIFWQRPYSR